MTFGMAVAPQEPKDVDCEWCGDPSVKAVEHHKSKGRYTYACGRHLALAEAANAKPERKRSS